MDKRPVSVLNKCMLTRFHSKRAPRVSIVEYLEQLSQLSEFSALTLLSILIYVRKICNIQPGLGLSDLTVHRILLICVAVSIKVQSDRWCSIVTMARAGGVRPEELTVPELELLMQLAWDVIPRERCIVGCYLSLVDRNGGYILFTADNVL